MQLNRASILTFALILAVVQSTTSHPIQTSKLVNTEQFKRFTRGIWKVFEKEEFDLLSDSPHLKSIGNPTWPINPNNDSTEQDTPDDRYTTGTSKLEKPAVSIPIATSPEIPEPMYKQFDQHTGEKQKHRSDDKESSSSVVAAQRQNHYGEILQYLHTKNALNNKHKHTTPASFAHSSSGHSIAFFAYRFSFPTLRSKDMTLLQYPLPGVFTTVIILLVMVWVAIFTIGLVELGNYIWRRRQEALPRDDQDLYSEEIGFDETMKVPLRIVIAPSESTRPHFAGAHGYEFLESVSSDSEVDSDSGSESDEDDYRIF
ncbi:unnamed protein product [Penicillium glandicola]